MCLTFETYAFTIKKLTPTHLTHTKEGNIYSLISKACDYRERDTQKTRQLHSDVTPTNLVPRELCSGFP